MISTKALFAILSTLFVAGLAALGLNGEASVNQADVDANVEASATANIDETIPTALATATAGVSINANSDLHVQAGTDGVDSAASVGGDTATDVAAAVGGASDNIVGDVIETVLSVTSSLLGN